MSDKRQAAQAVVKRWTAWSIAPGVLPVPVLDWVALTGLQMKMVADLCKVYETPFNEKLAKTIVTTVLTGAVPHVTLMGGMGLAGRYLKFVPVIGPLAGLGISTAMTTATTYAVGQVFINGFERGLDLESMDAQSMAEDFKGEYQEAKDTAKDGAEPATA